MHNEFLMGFILEWGIWMRRIILTTESGADLPEELAIKHNVQVVPMHVIMDGKDYLDGSLPVTEIYDYYERTKKIPSTTSTNSHEYLEFFTKIKNDIPDCIIVHIGYTSKASSSFQNAIIATEDLNDIYLIDALNVTGGLTAIVMYAVTLLENEPSIDPEHLVEKIKSVVPKSRLAFVPGSLEFLRAGGRVSNLAYLGGALLKIKPRIELIDGNLTSTKKYRGSMDAVSEKLMRDYLDQYDIDRGQLYLLYSIGLDERIKQRMVEIANDNGFKNVKWIQAGAMISTHAGPGGVGIVGLEN
jgi:DegV family protein with EDD domain